MKPSWFRSSFKTLSQPAMAAARQRQSLLLKSPGSLGELEELVVRLAGMQNTPHPRVARVRLVIFAGDHGVAAVENVSPYPREATRGMMVATAQGKGAAGVLARALDADLEVVNVAVLGESREPWGGINQRVAEGTHDFRKQPAMDEGPFLHALQAGRHAVQRAVAADSQLFVGGDLGVGNSTAAAAMATVLLGVAPETVTGPGSGVDEHGMARKVAVITQALAVHQGFLNDPMEILRYLGGYEIAALTGAYVACAQEGIPALVDGFVSSLAALVAVSVKPAVREWLFFAHRADEPGHLPLLQAMSAHPLLCLGVRLGQGAGAALAVPLLRLACDLHNGLATFEEAGVSPPQLGY